MVIPGLILDVGYPVEVKIWNLLKKLVAKAS